MDRLESYRDLCKEIELWEIRLEDLQRERNRIVKRVNRSPQTKLCANYDGIPGAGMPVIDFAKAWRDAAEIDEQIAEVRDILSLKREAKKRMERVMEGMEKLEYRVAYLRDVERVPLEKIANELGYTYGWIRKVSMRVKRLRIS